MSKIKTILYNRYCVVHIEKNSNFSKVFYALDTYQSPPRSCLIKVFEPRVKKPEIIKWISEEFQKEAKRLKQLSLNNQYLPQIYTYFNEFQVYYIVRELIEGKTTKEIQSKFSTQQVREILIELLSVLDYLHQHQVIHQNIKPKNVILRDEDKLPMLLDFGSIKQIVATYGFYGNKQIFSANNVDGYAPPEQIRGKSLPASDLYSLGLTAVYLLTGKHPVDLAIDSHSGFKIPETIARLDSDLAAILTRAISLNAVDRYSSAREMSISLLAMSSSTNIQLQQYSMTSGQPNKLDRDYSHRSRDRDSSLWKTIVYALSVLYIISMGLIALYDWRLSNNISAIQLPSSSLSSPTMPAAPAAAPEKPVETRRSILSSESRSRIIPILPTGTQKKRLKEVLGQPNAIEKGYWANSTAWIYQDRADGLIDLGYLFDLNTDKLRQTEVAIAPSMGLKTIDDILDSLLLGEITLPISQGLEKVYRREINEYSFRLGNLEGNIQREADNHIYLGVWEADFH